MEPAEERASPIEPEEVSHVMIDRPVLLTAAALTKMLSIFWSVHQVKATGFQSLEEKLRFIQQQA